MIVLDRYAARRIAVFGLARSGLSAARALLAGGAKVMAWDDGEAARRTAAEAGIALTEPTGTAWDQAEMLVLAPGVPLTHPKPHPVVARARQRKIPVIGDIELFLTQVMQGATPRPKLIGVTGTNGKSTTSALIGHVLRQAGRAVQIGGNLGMPVLALEPLGANGIYVLEMSTFQIDLTPSWHADAAVLLNITPDHLDRHGNMANYIAVKRRIFDRRADNDIAVIGIDDAPSGAIAKELIAAGGTVLPIAIGHAAPQGVSVVEGMLYGQDRMVADISRLPALLGRHNWQNAAAAFAVARSFGVDVRTIFAGLASFPGLAHRMETVGRVGGTIFVNDSKATNADAAAKALACYNSIYWIAGGRAKEGGIATLADYFPRVRHAYLIGEAAADFADTLAGKAPASISGTIERAVVQAYAQAMSDGYDNAVVLLSPACASYDQFRDFEHRGDIFRRLVAALVAGDTKAGGAAA